jgi:DNA (cytosine-5)-methyltransferase 1
MSLKKKEYLGIDLFSGCGGLSEGMRKAGFKIKAAVEIDYHAVAAYRLNHKDTKIFQIDIKNIKKSNLKQSYHNKTLHLLAGCPPCQGFSSIRRLNKKASVKDKRNSLLLEYLRLVKDLEPLTIMMENVPGLENYYLFKHLFKELKRMGYDPKKEIVNVKDYGIPQSRKRLVLVGSRIGDLDVASGTCKKVTVRDAIGKLEPIEATRDHVHQVVATHTPRIKKMIELVPKNGGSRGDLPEEYILDCHKKKGIGFNDVYGRLRWDDFSSTITGGCLNPSKGRFLHPEENRCISAREAALLQSFPRDYKFPTDIPKTSLALLIGNALPPQFSYIQSKNIKEHLDKYFA